MAEMSPLRRRMIEDMTIRNLSPATQQSYVHAVSKFSRYFGHSPDRLGSEDVRAYQVHLISKGVSWASLNQVVCALRFFYGVTLGCDAIPERIAYAREPRKLPAGHRQLERTPGRREAIFLRDELGRSARLGDLAPSRKGSLARSAAEVGRGGFGIRDVEEVRDLIVNRQKPLCLPG